jgi:hypothetical protein
MVALPLASSAVATQFTYSTMEAIYATTNPSRNPNGGMTAPPSGSASFDLPARDQYGARVGTAVAAEHDAHAGYGRCSAWATAVCQPAHRRARSSSGSEGTKCRSSAQRVWNCAGSG